MFDKTKNDGKTTRAVNRHMFPEFAHMSDDEALAVMTKHSNNIQAGYNRAEAWTVLYNAADKHLKEQMDSVYSNVEYMNKWE